MSKKHRDKPRFRSPKEMRRMEKLFEGVQHQNAPVAVIEGRKEENSLSDMSALVNEAGPNERDLFQRVVQEFQDYRYLLDYTTPVGVSDRYPLEGAYDRFMSFSREYRENHPYFTRNSLINAGIAAEKLASLNHDRRKWILACY